MENESLFVEEAHVKDLRLFKCPNFKQEEEGFILFRIYNTEYSGKPGTRSETIQGWEPKYIGFKFDSNFFRCLNDLPLDDDEHDEVFKTVNNTNCFGFEANVVLTQEICGYMRSCYGMCENTFLGLDHDSELKNDFLLVIVVDVCVRTASMDYWEAKLTLLDEKDQFSTQDNQDEVTKSSDVRPNIDDMGSTRAYDDGGDLRKASGESSDVDMDDDNDYGDHDGVGMQDSKDMHVEDKYDDYDDGGDVGMQEDDGGLDYYCFDEHGKDCLYDIIECVKVWKEVSQNEEEPILMYEVKPSLTIEEMKLELMEDGNYKPLISTTNMNLVDVDECSICISGFTENVPKSGIFPWCPKMNSSRVVRLGCGHVFHHHCIFKWLSKTSSCPLCRTSSLAGV